MPPTVIQELHISSESVARRVLALQLRSYAVEARLLGSNALPPLHDTVQSLKTCGETFFGCFEGEEPTAVVSYKRQDAVLDIHRLFVAPEHFREGRASALLRSIETVEVGVERITVSTGSRNTPALGLYTAHGFTRTGEIEAAPGLSVTRLEKTVRPLAASSGGC